MITLHDGTTILIDCKIREKTETEAGNVVFPVKSDLVKSLKTNSDGAPYVDVFILTHPDQDHCLGFSNHFYNGKSPSNYKDKNKENEEIIIHDLWCTSMLFNEATNDDAKALKKEAERRRKLWRDDDHAKNQDGNRIRMIGYDGDNKFEKLPASVPGDVLSIENINPKSTDKVFEFFVHSPFKDNLVQATAQSDKNFSSIAMQARFKINSFDSQFVGLFLFGGDADHNIWKTVLDKSTKHDNLDKLEWDIFLAPHHCSWTYFNDVPYEDKEDNKVPKESSLEILDYKRPRGRIIASSKAVRSTDKNPPHAQAKTEYQKKLDNNKRFVELALVPSEKEPKPTVYEISATGIIDVRVATAGKIASTSVMSGNWSSGES